ncbi:MAG: FAD synthetase family protein [Oscillospiraceae bacterium]|nr:FAD synthetase family protein [Oscillospiraceae bacterium]
MKIYECTAAIEPDQPRAVAVGVFDGLHLGHRAVISRMLAVSAEQGLIPCVLTFDMHIQNRIMRREAFEANLREMGVKNLIRLPFDTVRELSPERFAEDILGKILNTKAIFCGSNFRFGKGAAADVRELRELGEVCGFLVEALPLLEHNREPISSTRIRLCIKQGNTQDASTMLGGQANE